MIGLMATLLWQIWKDKNDSFLGNKSPNLMFTLRKVTVLAAEYLQLHLAERKHSSLVPKSQSRVSWRPRLIGMLKCNVDVAYSPTRQVGAVSAIMRDNQG